MRVAELMLLLAAFAAVADWQRLWNDGARAEAIEALAAEVERHPDDRALRRQLAEFEVAVHRYVAALEHMKPLGDEVRALRGVAFFRVGDYANALTHLKRDDIEEALMRIDALEALGRFTDCDVEAVEARSHFGPLNDSRILACEGRRLLRVSDPAKAAVVFRLAVDADPWNGEALFGLGRALMMSGAREEGLVVLTRHRELRPKLDRLEFARRSVDLAPAHAPNFTALADAERELGRFARAEDAYRTAGRLATCAELVPNALRYARLLTEDRNDPHKAVDLLVACAGRCPDARLFVRAGDLQRGLSRPGEALALYSRALALRPEDSEIKARIEQVNR
jgi:tetratricopeptide (TPR) repeat protein